MLPAGLEGEAAAAQHRAHPGHRVPADRGRRQRATACSRSATSRTRSDGPRAPAADVVALRRLRRMPADASPGPAPGPDLETWSGVRTGPLARGRVGAPDRREGPPAQHPTRGREQFFTTKGAIAHDDLIGHDEGLTVTSTKGGDYLAFRPLLSEFVVSMPRGAAVVYPKDAAQIVAMADIFPGRARGRGRGRLRRADVLAAASGRPARPGLVLRAARGVRGRRPAQRRAVLRRRPPRLVPHGRGPGRRAARLRREPRRTAGWTGSCSTCWRPGSAWTPSPTCSCPAASSAPTWPRRPSWRAPSETHPRPRRLHRAHAVGVAGPRVARRGARRPARATG